jgi:solute carrier family 9B (sodium/hydrogen exchanger), member 1/2
VIVLHVIHTAGSKEVERLREQAQMLLADIRYRFITIEGTIPESIVRTAQDYKVDEIVMGKRGHRSFNEVLVGSVSRSVLESSPIPVIIVEDNEILSL